MALLDYRFRALERDGTHGGTIRPWRQHLPSDRALLLAFLAFVLFCHLLSARQLSMNPDGKVYKKLYSSIRAGRARNKTANAGYWEWGEWGPQSGCTRTCGVGVRSRKRYCYENSVNGSHHVSARRLCMGNDRQFELCSTQDCGSGEVDVRAKLCAAYNRKPYRGKRYKWTPYEPEPGKARTRRKFAACALVCRATQQQYTLVVKFSRTVLTSTPCLTHGVPGVCIARACAPIGCDKKLYSTVTVDKCGICGGNNHTCIIESGNIRKNISLGYARMLTIPPRSRHIRVTDLGRSAAVFALRNDKMLYFVSGKHMRRNPTVYSDVGGATFYYHRPLYEKSGQEMIESAGPTNETLHIMMVSAEPETQIELSYEYTIPKDTGTSLRVEAPPTELTDYAFMSDKEYDENLFTFQRIAERNSPLERKRFVGHYSRESSNNSEENNKTDSKESTVLEKTEKNNTTEQEKKHQYYWKVDKKAPCSATCKPGVLPVYTTCYRDNNKSVDDNYCDQTKRPEPVNVRCNRLPCVPRWLASSWSKCSVSCEEGYQYRSIRCWRILGPGFDSTVHDRLCRNSKKPIAIRPCRQVACGPLWQTSDWGPCSNQCGSGIQIRDVTCTGKNCDFSKKPVDVRHCNTGTCATRWDVGKWSECSGSCGNGWKRRRVTCLDNEVVVLDRLCNQPSRPLTVYPCSDQPDCPPIWAIQDWGVCSVECGKGVQRRHVVCSQIVKDKFVVKPGRVCRHLPKPRDEADCSRPACPAKWFVTEWSQCSKTCGGYGWRVRQVQCLHNLVPSLGCSALNKPASAERCLLPECFTGSTCHNLENTGCDMVVKFKLCKHHYYKRACCRTCKNVTY